MSRLEQLKRELEPFATPEGFSTTLLLQLPESFRALLQRAIREGSVGQGDIAAGLELSDKEAAEMAEFLVGHGFLQVEEADSDAVYVPRLAKSRRPWAPVGVWERLGEEEGGGES